MSRILIWKQASPGSEYDIFLPTDHAGLYQHVQKTWNGACKNWGNRVWFQGIYSAIDTGENEYAFISDTISVDEINQSFDMILFPTANIFYEGFLGAIRELTEIFEKIRIPIYVVVCGVQADSYDALEDVLSAIGEDSRRFIRAIYNTGGEFALRGYFTKEFFERLGFPQAVVTGCPSLYQMGPDFQVPNQKQDLSLLNPVFNGYVKPFARLLQEYRDSAFIDQCDYFGPLLQPDYLADAGFRFRMGFEDRYGVQAAQLLAEGRIVMIPDVNDWRNFMKQKGFNYAFGSRIHGTIMALLSDIPATIVTFDSRTREMAEFFDIPRVQAKHNVSFDRETFCQLYEAADYTRFNQTFREKYELFGRFLTDHGIVTRLNPQNRFFAEEDYRVLNGTEESRQAFAAFSARLKKEEPALKVCNQGRRIAGRIIGHAR